MATKAKAVVEEVVETPEAPANGKGEPGAFSDLLHRVLLASIGAVALAQEEIEDFVNRLIERGEIAEKDGKKMVNDVMDNRKKQAKKSAQKAEDEVNKQVEQILERLNVPSKADIDTLTEKIASLSKKVDELKKSG
jgi:poly(hydroxyalkanoate) granule-associated protein